MSQLHRSGFVDGSEGTAEQWRRCRVRAIDRVTKEREGEESGDRKEEAIAVLSDEEARWSPLLLLLHGLAARGLLLSLTLSCVHSRLFAALMSPFPSLLHLDLRANFLEDCDFTLLASIFPSLAISVIWSCRRWRSCI